MTEACHIFSNRDLALCQNAYHYGEDPVGNPPPNVPIQCSDTGTLIVSCYMLGYDAGYSAAEKEIIRCHLISVPPAVDHSPQFEKGWIGGWLQANKESHNDTKNTYGLNCTKILLEMTFFCYVQFVG